MSDYCATEAGVRVERVGHTLVATLVNPGRRNAFTPEMRRQLTRKIEEASGDDDVRAIVLRGDGSDFCAGADISRIEGGEASSALAFRERLKDIHRLIRTIALGSKPVIAAIEGVAAGGGLSIALACDIIVVSRDARLGFAFTKIGLMAEMGCLFTLTQRVGAAKARRMLLMSETFSGEAAVRSGIADFDCDPGNAFDFALDAAERLAQAAPLAVAATKAAVGGRVSSLEDAFQLELDVIPRLTTSADFREGVTAFREKRSPSFTGR